jgi:hypothetical protein
MKEYNHTVYESDGILSWTKPESKTCDPREQYEWCGDTSGKDPRWNRGRKHEKLADEGLSLDQVVWYEEDECSSFSGGGLLDQMVWHEEDSGILDPLDQSGVDKLMDVYLNHGMIWFEGPLAANYVDRSNQGENED